MDNSDDSAPPRPKFGYLKKGTCQQRILQRSAAIQTPSNKHLKEDNANSSSLVNNIISPILSDGPAKTKRPTTAETGDSGFREKHSHSSPTNLTSSSDTLTTENKGSRPLSSSPKESDSILAQQLATRNTNKVPHSARRIESYTSYLSPSLSHSSYERGTPDHGFLENTIKSLGLFPPEKFTLPPRPKPLPSPEKKEDMYDNFRTPASRRHARNFLDSPILPPNFIEKKEGHVVESLAEQLRALVVLMDAGRDERRRKVQQLKYIYDEKANDLKRKEKEMKERTEAEEKKLIDLKARMKLESERMKDSKEAAKQMEKEVQELRNKVAEKSSLVAQIRISKNELLEKLKKMEDELAKEKVKSSKLENTTARLRNDIDYERKVNLLTKPNPPAVRQEPPTRPPLRQIQIPRPNPFGKPTVSHQKTEELKVPEQPAPSARRLTNTSSSSVGCGRNVQWKEQIQEVHEISTSFSTNISNTLKEDIISGRNFKLLNLIDNPDFVEEQYGQHGRYRIMKKCGCESIRYDNSDMQYRCLKDVNIDLRYFGEDGNITVTLPGQYIIKSFTSKQFEIHREANEMSIVEPDGTRKEKVNVPGCDKQAIETFKDEWKRLTPYGSGHIEEWIIAEDDNITTKRGEYDYVTQDNNCITFYWPGFVVSRSLTEDGMVGILCKIDEKRTLKIKICPEDGVFRICHCDGNRKDYCTKSEKYCEHIIR